MKSKIQFLKYSGKHTRKDFTQVAMLSNFFSNIPDNLFCTNGMYSDFRDSIILSIEIYDPKDKIVVDIFETNPSGEDQRKFALIGFRKYISTLYNNLMRDFRKNIANVCFFMVIGVLLELYVHGICTDLPEWSSSILDIGGWALIWTFVCYWAFDFAGQRKQLQRLKQIENMEFRFKLWE